MLVPAPCYKPRTDKPSQDEQPQEDAPQLPAPPRAYAAVDRESRKVRSDQGTITDGLALCHALTMTVRSWKQGKLVAALTRASAHLSSQWCENWCSSTRGGLLSENSLKNRNCPGCFPPPRVLHPDIWTQGHCCPVKKRTDSIGCRWRRHRSWDDWLKRLVARASSRKA